MLHGRSAKEVPWHHQCRASVRARSHSHMQPWQRGGMKLRANAQEAEVIDLLTGKGKAGRVNASESPTEASLAKATE